MTIFPKVIAGLKARGVDDMILVGGGAFAVLARGAGFVRGDLRSWLEPRRPARAPPVSQAEV